jgi:hypothetical protein
VKRGDSNLHPEPLFTFYFSLFTPFLPMNPPILRLLADLVVLIHFAFVLFVVAGGMLALRWPAVAWAHLPAASWGAWIEFTGGICPLTPLEDALRERAGEAAYTGDFVSHYVLPVLYPAALTRPTQLGLGLLVVGVNGGVYAWLWARRRRRGHPSPSVAAPPPS